jgi:anti-sigma factor RsiW
MRCSKVTKMLGAFEDGELDAHVAEEVERHIAQCAACRREFEALRSVASFLGGALAPPEIAGFATRVAAAAAKRRAVHAVSHIGTGAFAWHRLATPVHAAAVFGCAVGLTLGILMGSGTTGTPADDTGASAASAADALGTGYLAEAPAGSLAEAYLSALGPYGQERGGSR